MKHAATSLALHVLALLGVVFALYPVLWVISTAVGGTSTPTGGALPVPAHVSLSNFQELIQGSFLIQLGNSLVIAVATAVLSVAIATPAAYSIARMDFVGKDMSMRTLLATQMFPGVASSIPLYLILDAIGLINTRSGLALVYATTSVPFAIFQLRTTFENIPRDLEEAAMVDGATRFGAFVRVALPLARPGIAVTTLFAFMTAWNEFILAATFLSKEDLFTLPVVLQRYVGEYDANWGVFSAGALVVSIPVMALFYYAQRHFAGGLGDGAIKG